MLRADVQSSFFRRYLWIAVACVVVIGWCGFDIQVTYPGKQVIAEAYESLPDTIEREGTWVQLAEENGWSTDTPTNSVLIFGESRYSLCQLAWRHLNDAGTTTT